MKKNNNDNFVKAHKNFLLIFYLNIFHVGVFLFTNKNFADAITSWLTLNE